MNTNIAETATVDETATVEDTAKIYGTASVTGGARILDHAKLFGSCAVRGGTVRDHATMGGSSRVFQAELSGRARLDKKASVYPGVKIHGNAHLTDNVVAAGDDTEIFGRAFLANDVQVQEGARIHGGAHIESGVICKDADVFMGRHVISIRGLFPDAVTIYRTKDGSPRVQAGCRNFMILDNLLILAEDHGWELPVGWVDLQLMLELTTRSWKDDVCTHSCCATNED